jgi:hypothetical protein
VLAPTLGSSLDLSRLQPASTPIGSGGLGFRGRESKVPHGRVQMRRIKDRVSRRRPTGHRAHRRRQHHRRPPSPALPSPSHFLTGLSLRRPRGISGSGRGSPRGQGGESHGGAPGRAGEAAFFGSACRETLQRARFRAASHAELFCAPVWHGSSLHTRSGAAGSRAKRTLKHCISYPADLLAKPLY